MHTLLVFNEESISLGGLVGAKRCPPIGLLIPGWCSTQ